MHCLDCARTPELPQKPNISISPDATPNVPGFLDVMFQEISKKATDIFFMIEHGDFFLRLKMLQDRTSKTAFNAYYSLWIPTFDAPTYVMVDRGSNLAAEHVKKKLHEVES